MTIGLAGANRTGKSTLAKAWSEASGIPFVTISVGDVIARRGWECKDITKIEDRIDVQQALVEEAHRIFSKASRAPFISDRTPIDIAAYMLADILQAPLSDRQHVAVERIVSDCIDITNQAFGGILLLPPVLPYVEERGKPPANISYQWHIHFLILGILTDQRVGVANWTVRQDVLDLESRIEALSGIWEDILDDAISCSNGSVLH